MIDDTKLLQRWAGVPDDGVYGPVTARALVDKLGLRPRFDRQAFLARYVNRNAPAITNADINRAAERLNVSPAHIRMVRKVESAGQSFDPQGRPVILFEPHVFHRRTQGRYSPATFSYANRKDRPYPASFDGRWTQLADAAAKDEQAALESASWGAFQIMGFHWRDLGYDSAQAFTESFVESEGAHLEAVVRFIEKGGLAPALRRCKAGDPDSCRDFAKAYNGSGYAAHDYHGKMARALG